MAGSGTTKGYARELRKAGNMSEALLWRELKNRKLCGLKFIRQQTIGEYIADFYCPEEEIVIEIDGISHDSKIAHDERRDEYMRTKGVKVIRVKDVDVRKNMDGVIDWIKGNISHTPSSPSEMPPL